MHPVAQGSLIGGGVGLLLAVVRRPKEGERDNVVARVAKSVAEGAAAGAVVGVLVDRRLRAAATALLVDNAPVVIDAVGEVVDVVGGAVGDVVDAVGDVVGDAAASLRQRFAA